MKDKNGAVDKSSSEQHFRKSAAITLISGALHLAQSGFTAGRQAGRRYTGEFRNFQNWL